MDGWDQFVVEYSVAKCDVIANCPEMAEGSYFEGVSYETCLDLSTGGAESTHASAMDAGCGEFVPAASCTCIEAERATIESCSPPPGCDPYAR